MRLSDIFEIQRKLDLILKTLGVDPDSDKPQGLYCVVYPPFMLLFHGGYYECLDYLEHVYGLQTNMMPLDEYNRMLEASGYEPLEI